jgi:hypothetical protein
MSGHQRAMRRLSSLVLLAAAMPHLTGCGARTGFDVGLDEGAQGPSDASTSPRATVSPNEDEGVLCAFHVGPVSSCNVPVTDGPVQRCGPPFGHCIDVGGQWGCCNSPSNNNGAGGSCSFPSGIPCE